MSRRPSTRTVQVLQALLDAEGDWIHGYDIVTGIGIASGSLYPILMRLHDRGVLETRWEDSPTEGRPPRHLYRLTVDGKKWASAAVAEAAITPLRDPELGTA